MKRENFYRRSPTDALSGMVGMTLEERGAYNTIIDLLYLTWRPLEDSRGYIANHCGCAVQKLNPIIASLIAKRKLLQFEEGGVQYLSNQRFETERMDVKGASGTRSGRAGVGEKSGEVGEKSAGVGKNPPTCDHEPEQNQPVLPLDKTRVEKTRQNTPAPSGPVVGDVVLEAIWALASRKSRERSGKEALGKSIAAAAKAGHDPDRIRRGLAGYFASEEATRDGGKYVAGVHRLVKDGRWEAFADDAPAPTLQIVGGLSGSLDQPGEVRQRAWMAEYRTSPNSWRPERGPAPGVLGCRVAPEIQREFGVEPAKPQPIVRIA